MVPGYHDRGAYRSFGDHLVDELSEVRPLAVSEPANARRQPFPGKMFLSQSNPVDELLVVGKLAHDKPVGFHYVLGVTAHGDPSEWSATLAEQRSYVKGNETLEVECVTYPGLEGLTADVITVLEDYAAHLLQL